MKRLGHGLTLPRNDAEKESRQKAQPPSTAHPAAQGGDKVKVASQAAPVAVTATATPTIASKSLGQPAPADGRHAHTGTERHTGAADTTHSVPLSAPSGGKRPAPPLDGDAGAEGTRESKRSARE
jgi:hypothetical protein